MAISTFGMYMSLKKSLFNYLEYSFNLWYTDQTSVFGRKHIIQPTGFGAYSSICFEWDGEDVSAPSE